MEQNYLYFFLFLLLSTPLVKAVELDAIAITASRTSVSLNATGSAVTVISEQELRDRQQTYIADVLRTVPGVAVSQTGGVGQFTQIRMRGSEANHVLVIIDGIEYNPGNGNSVNVAHLLTTDVERIEILRGAQSTLWGSDAIGGVIAITTRRGRRGKTNVFITQQEGSFNSSEQAISLSGGNNKTTYALSLSRINNSGFSVADDDPFIYTLPDGSQVTQGGSGVENDGYENRSIGTTINHRIVEDLSINLAVREINYELDGDGFASGVGVVDDTVPASSSKGLYAQTTLNYSQLNGRLQHKLKLADTDLDDTFVSTFGTLKARTKNRQYSYQLDYYFPQSSNSNTSHSATLVLEREKVSNDSAFSGVHANAVNSVVLEYRFDLGERLSTAIAYRRDNNDIFKKTKSGHASLSYAINSQLRLHGSTGTGIKNPTLHELFGSSANYQGNGALKAEKSNSIDGGLTLQVSPLSKLDVTIFSLQINDQITGAGNTSINVDGEAKARGVEFSFHSAFGKQLSLTGSFTMQNSKDAKGKALVRRADIIASVSGTYSSLANKLRITLGMDYNGSQYDYYFGSAPSYTRSLVKVDAYTVVNLSASYQPNNTLSFTGKIGNLFNERYQEAIGYGTAERAYYLGLRVELQ